MSRARAMGLIVAIVTGGLAAASPARAFDAYWRCRDIQGYCDPYAYRREQPRYYPYRNSGEWAPAWAYRQPRYGFLPPPYYKAWGYPRRASFPPRHARRRWRDDGGGW